MEIPDALSYTEDHEWARFDGTTVLVGITDFAQDALGDVVFVELPEVGSEVAAGGVLGEIESTKSVSEIYAPIGGKVTEVNGDLPGAPERVNSDPYGAGWICRIETELEDPLAGLLDAAGYRTLTEELS